MKRPEHALLLVIASMVFILTMTALLLGFDGVRLGIALTILGGIAGYIARAIIRAAMTENERDRKE